MNDTLDNDGIFNKVWNAIQEHKAMKTIGEKLKELRESKNTVDENGKVTKYTQANLEADTGISIQSIRAYESNKTIPESKNAKILADFFSVTLESLLNDSMDIVYLSNIKETDYTKELGLSNKSIENIKKLPLTLNSFFESEICIKFISKLDLLISLKENLYKKCTNIKEYLSVEYIKMDKETYIALLQEKVNELIKTFEDIPNINLYMSYTSFIEQLDLAISTIEINPSNDDFDYWCSNIKSTIIEIENEIIRAKKIIKYEISTELNSFLNTIYK